MITSRIARMAAGAAVASALIAASPAMAQDSGANNWGSFLGMLGLGLGGSATPEIDYRERPPLVVPPRSSLPSPQEREAARQRANWPNDPDMARRRAATEDDGEIYLFSERARVQSDRGGRIRLSPDELARGRTGPEIVTGPVGGQPSILDDRTSGSAMVYDPMRQMRESDARRAQAAADLPLGQERPRRLLSDPPPGYRAPTQRLAAPAAEPVMTPGERDFGVQDFTRRNAGR